MDDLRNLRSFTQVARHGSFAAAAAHLAISPPALSKSIARLEASLGVRLFVRTTRHMELTTEGARLLERIGDAFGTIEDAVTGFQSSDSQRSGLVRLSATTSYARHCVLPVLREFLDTHPGIQVRLSVHDGGRGISRQADDLRITWGEEREQGKVARLLCRLKLVLVASPFYIQRHGLPRRPNDLATHQCVASLLPSGSRPQWKFTRTTRRGVTTGPTEAYTPTGALTIVDELDAVADAALLGLGVTVVAEFAAIDAIREGRLIQLLPAYEIVAHSSQQSEMIIQYASASSMPRRVRIVLDFLIERLTRPMKID